MPVNSSLHMISKDLSIIVVVSLKKTFLYTLCAKLEHFKLKPNFNLIKPDVSQNFNFLKPEPESQPEPDPSP